MSETKPTDTELYFDEKLSDRIKEAYRWATPGPYYFDSGNGDIESHNKEHYRCTVANRPDLSDRFKHFKDFNLKINPPDSPADTNNDMEFIELAMNNIIPAISEIDSLRAENAELRDTLRRFEHECEMSYASNTNCVCSKTNTKRIKEGSK